MKHSNNFKDLTGQVFGKLTVLNFAYTKNNRSYWNCLCTCGNKCVVCGKYLINGDTKSCGCYKKERQVEANTKHNLKNKRVYNIWLGIKARCYNKNSDNFKYYGGRGIKICDEWLNNPVAFYNWSMENGYSEKLEIDRIDNDKNYSPNNCRWTTRKNQNRNSSHNNFITYNGKTKCLTEWAEELGIKRTTLSGRINIYHWTIERAFETK